MPSNSKSYWNKYYNEVLKPKRQKQQKERQKEVKNNFTGVITVQRVCPICNKSWEETIEWKSSHRPSVKKQCAECTLQKLRTYQKSAEYRSMTNAHIRQQYAESEELRKKKKESTNRWRQKKNNSLDT
jgi:hypothetical protein